MLDDETLEEEQDSIVEDAEIDDPLYREMMRREAKGEDISDLLDLMDKPATKTETFTKTKSTGSFWEKPDGG